MMDKILPGEVSIEELPFTFHRDERGHVVRHGPDEMALRITQLNYGWRIVKYPTECGYGYVWAAPQGLFGEWAPFACVLCDTPIVTIWKAGENA
jgi:hypothetical protein